MIIPGRAVKDVDISENTNTDEIFKELEQSGGFEARNVAEGVDILYNMISDEKCTKLRLVTEKVKTKSPAAL